MAVTKDKPAPYAPAGTVVEIITRYRTRGLPSPVNADVLARAGVSDSLIPRTLLALQTLDLIDDQGRPTPTFEGLRLASEAEYKQRMAEWLNQAYADVIAYVDPSSDDDIKVRDAFRSYNPVGQQGRMVTLFLGLYRAAGIVPEQASQPRSTKIVRPARRAAPPRKSDPAITRKAAHRTDDGNIPAPLAGMLAKLPREGEGWTQERRDSFMTAFGSVLDFSFPIVETEPVGSDQSDSNDEE